MKHRILAVLATAAMATLSVGIAGAPAYADCPNNRFCLYESHDYKDGEYVFSPTGSCANLPSGINNDANAMRNYRNHAVVLWDLPGCGGSTTYTADAFSYDSNFGNNKFSNKASSMKRI